MASCRASGSKAAPRAGRTASDDRQKATGGIQHSPTAPRWQKVAWRGAVDAGGGRAAPLGRGAARRVGLVAGAGRRVPNRGLAIAKGTHKPDRERRASDAYLTRQKRRLALLAAGARALVAPVAPARPATVAKAFEASQMEGAQAPFGFWDPFGFAKTSPEALTWYRAAELKHGRVAMVACMGFIAQSYPLTNMASVPLAKASLYPKLSTVDVTFGDLAAAGNPVEQFKLIPTLGLWQFAFVAGMIETYGEFQKPHYLRGGAIGRNTLIWDPVGQLIRGEPITDTLSDEVRAKKRNMELANGRLAMIGAMGFSAHYMIEGSVPFVFGNY